MRRLFNNIVSVLHSAFRFALMKVLNWNGFRAGIIQRFSPNVVFEMNRGSKVTLGKMVRAHSGCKFKVRKNAELIIGSGVKINYNCIFVCRNRIIIGEGTEFGPSVYIYDHDHDYRAGLKENKFKESPVIIGKNCWIGANTIILRGSVIGDNAVIAAGTVVNGTVPANSVAYNPKELAVKQYVKTTSSDCPKEIN